MPHPMVPTKWKKWVLTLRVLDWQELSRSFSPTISRPLSIQNQKRRIIWKNTQHDYEPKSPIEYTNLFWIWMMVFYQIQNKKITLITTPKHSFMQVRRKVLWSQVYMGLSFGFLCWLPML